MIPQQALDNEFAQEVESGSPAMGRNAACRYLYTCRSAQPEAITCLPEYASHPRDARVIQAQ